MYTFDQIYRSLLYHTRSFTPLSVFVVDGASYGVRLDDPTGQSPVVTVTMEDVGDLPIELGSLSSSISVTYTIDAQSRTQRDALKTIVYSGIRHTPRIPVYSAFDDFTPASGAVILYDMEFADPMLVRDMPNFNTDREQFFWTALVFAEVQILGV